MVNKIKQGFTLIELLVVVIIIGILVAIALPKYIDTVDIAVGKRAYDSMQMIYAAQLRFSADNTAGNHAFAGTFPSLDVSFPSATAQGDKALNFGKFVIQMDATQATTGDSLTNYKIVFNFVNETKQCIVNSNLVKGSRICRAIGGEDRGGGFFDLR